MISRDQAARSGRWLEPAITSSEKKLRHLLDVAARRGADEVALRRVWARLAQVPDLVHPNGNGGQEVQGGQGGQGGQRDGRIRWWPWALSASLVGAAAAVTILVLTPGPHSGEPVSASRATPVEAAEASGRPASAERLGDPGSDRRRSVLLAPATVRTGRGELLPLSLRGGTEVSLAAESELTLDGNDRPTVTVGEVRFHVPRQPSGQTFTVMARDYRIAVVGTRFVVRVSGPSTSVHVDQGVVEVWRVAADQRVARVGAGESWTSPLAAPDDIRSAHAARGAKTASKPASMTVSRAKHLARTSAMLGSVQRARGRHEDGASLSGAWASGAQAAGEMAPVTAPSATLSELGSASAPKGIPSGRTATGDTSTGAPAPVPPTAPTSPAAPALAPPSANLEVIALAIQAKTARASGNPERALAIYRALADKGGPAGENAEYETGRVQRDSLGQPQQAIASWRAYRARHPRGLLRIETDISIIETLVNSGDKSGALAEASEFIHRYPDGERHGEMARLVGDLSRERGECRAAVEAYDQALSDSRTRVTFRDDVTFHRATCLLASEPRQGTEALDAYLTGFPTGRFRSRAQRLIADVSSQQPPPSARP